MTAFGRLAVGLWLLAALALAALAVVAGVGAAVDPSPSPEIVVVTATPYRCVNGDVLGSSTACPMAIIYVGPTQTPDPYHVAGQAGDGRTFDVQRGWSYGDVAVAALLLVLVGVTGFGILQSSFRGA